jgi:hypothetical protein
MIYAIIKVNGRVMGFACTPDSIPYCCDTIDEMDMLLSEYPTIGEIEYIHIP